MEDLIEYSHEELANVGGQPESLADYRRTMEIRRRDLLTQIMA